jgi:hypothetical protein
VSVECLPRQYIRIIACIVLHSRASRSSESELSAGLALLAGLMVSGEESTIRVYCEFQVAQLFKLLYRRLSVGKARV